MLSVENSIASLIGLVLTYTERQASDPALVPLTETHLLSENTDMLPALTTATSVSS